MIIDLSGQWKLWLETDSGVQTGAVNLPGTIQGQGFGNPITNETPWVSGLYDAFWFEQEEYKQAQGEEVLVPFLAQPPKHFLGKAYYEREFEICYEETSSIADKKENNIQGIELTICDETESKYYNGFPEEWFLRIELTHWCSKVWIDDIYIGEDCSLCTAHEISCGKLSEGKHVLKICIDNSMQYPYRPDGHGVSDALGATWNGMAGEIVLETRSEKEAREASKREYAKQHPRIVEIKDGNFYIDGHPEYFRGTHFAGEYPLTGCPVTEISWWREKMQIIKAWGLNAIRCHSYCPPEAAFAAADEAGVYLLVECGMWNIFNEGIEMMEVLREESRRILKEFGHHPSFTFFSPSNEPGGSWYKPLRKWVEETRAYDRALGYEGRRAYTSQSGWYFDVPPAEIEGTDFVYFHRSAYGPYPGGTIRNHLGWKGSNYSPSLKGVKQPVICHELGQWCAYPDFNIIDKFTGYMKPGNYMVYKEQAEKQGVLPLNDTFVRCSGRNQFRLYKEELEANFRTPEIKGFELLDIHDYLGQGTALVGFLDAFWENKGYVKPEEFRSFCKETVLLAECSSYVWKNTQIAEIPVEVCHFGKEDLADTEVVWSLVLCERVKDNVDGCEETALIERGSLSCPIIKTGENTSLGNVRLDFRNIKENSHLKLILSMGELQNQWDLYVYADEKAEAASEVSDAAVSNKDGCQKKPFYTRMWSDALAALEQGKNVIYAPYLSDLNYECPVLSAKNVFWNSQMGPTWGRSLGIAVDEAHPIFRNFPTEESGGWQWEDILERARGFKLNGMDGCHTIVRSIDDWNRSLSLGLILEAKVKKGNLLIVSADLEGSFEERPAAYALKQAILAYVSSEEFKPEYEMSAAQIEANLFPVLRMETLVKECVFDADAVVRNADALFTANPQASAKIKKSEFPVSLTITLKHPVKAGGFLYLPEQKDRAHEGFLQDYRLEYLDEEGIWKPAAQGTLQNTSLSQKIMFAEHITAESWRLVVESCYGCVDKMVWDEREDGWYKVFKPQSAVLQIAGLHLICDEEAEHSDRIFWDREQKSATKEIDA